MLQPPFCTPSSACVCIISLIIRGQMSMRSANNIMVIQSNPSLDRRVVSQAAFAFERKSFLYVALKTPSCAGA